MSQSLQDRERRTYDVLSGNKGQRKQGYQQQRFLRAAPPKKEEKKVEEAPRRHWAELLATIEWAERMAGIYNIDREPSIEPAAVVAEVEDDRWTVPNQFKTPAPVSQGQKLDMNSILLHSMTTSAPTTQAEPAPANGNVLSPDLPMMQLQILALRPRL
ncbi:hypothetical protein DYH09_02825 [bacterium CPR1]|nr:hypothetical protein [bacterium CPR1]